MRTDVEFYRGYKIVEHDSRHGLKSGNVGFEVWHNDMLLSKGFAAIQDAKAKIDRMMDQPRQERQDGG